MLFRSWYLISPWGLSWDDENYYLVGFDSKAGKIKHYRVDKILRIQMSKEEREGKEHFQKLDMADYAKKSFGMFGGKEQTVKLLVHNSLAGVIIDRFGKDIMMIPEDEQYFTVNVDVHISRQFLGCNKFCFVHNNKPPIRSEERRVGKECSEPCRSRWSP